MSRVRVNRSHPDFVEVVLREGVGPLVFAARRWAEEAFGSLVAGALCGLPIYGGIALVLGKEPGPMWAWLGIAGALALVGNVFVVLYGAHRDVYRLRFSPAAAADTLTVVRASRADRPRPLTDVQQIWIDHIVTHKGDGKPVAEKITLHVLLRDGRRLRRSSLPPWTTDTTALYQELQGILAPAAVQVDLVVQRRVASPFTGGYGGSTGGGGGS